MPSPDATLTGAVWITAPPAPTAHWRLSFTPSLLGSIGPTDASRWFVKRGVFWGSATSAEVDSYGRVSLFNVGWDGTESLVRYDGPPPVLYTTAGGSLAAFTEHSIPF